MARVRRYGTGSATQWAPRCYGPPRRTGWLWEREPPLPSIRSMSGSGFPRIFTRTDFRPGFAFFFARLRFAMAPDLTSMPTRRHAAAGGCSR